MADHTCSARIDPLSVVNCYYALKIITTSGSSSAHNAICLFTGAVMLVVQLNSLSITPSVSLDNHPPGVSRHLCHPVLTSLVCHASRVIRYLQTRSSGIVPRQPRRHQGRLDARVPVGASAATAALCFRRSCRRLRAQVSAPSDQSVSPIG